MKNKKEKIYPIPEKLALIGELGESYNNTWHHCYFAFMKRMYYIRALKYKRIFWREIYSLYPELKGKTLSASGNHLVVK